MKDDMERAKEYGLNLDVFTEGELAVAEVAIDED
jgi:hypothetical protein